MSVQPTSYALRLFGERLAEFMEHHALDFEKGTDDVDWLSVVFADVVRLVQDGPRAYVDHVERLDAAAIERRLDAELERILGR